ncbi:MAG TPA: hypothetical protein ENI82_04125 [Bacteroidetes bacterium]|nr:hypothetical protein [Bacteroidota bacterium]
MVQLSDGIDTLYENRKKFIIIGLTGRTGSGCSSAAQILSKSVENITLPKPKLCGESNDRKYKIIYDFAQNNWEQFHWIQIKTIITSFILDNPYVDFEDYVSKTLATATLPKDVIREQLQKTIKDKYISLHKKRDELNKSRKKLEASNTIKKDQIEARREKSYDFYFKTLPVFTNELKETLNILSGNSYTKVYQLIGDNIRSSGKAFDSHFNAKNIYRISIRVNKIIKIFTKRAKKNKDNVYIVIDTFRNPFEAIFFRERYAAFYLLSINTKNAHREHRLKKMLSLTDDQLTEIDEKEGEQSYNDEKFFISQNIPKCIELSDIHINNPHVAEDDFSTLKKQLAWYVSLIMHPGLIAPSREERCMQMAYNAKLASGCLSRQVGATIANESNSIQAIGWNDPAHGQSPCLLRNVKDLINSEDTGVYSKYEKNNKKFRDELKRKYEKALADPNLVKKLCGRNVSYCFKKIQNEVDKKKNKGGNQVYTRSLHAEENAFLQIVKYGGAGIKGGKLYTTASPCELCSKKAYQLGIKDIIYIDPYPGIAKDHILRIGTEAPKLTLFHGAIGRAYNQLFEPVIPYKDELEMILSKK